MRKLVSSVQLVWRIGFGLCLACSCVSAWTQTLPDFGYLSMKRGGVAAQGTQPLLVIVASFSDGTPLTNSLDYFERRTFDIANSNSVNGCFWENSNHRFSWGRASGSGVVGPIPVPANQHLADWRALLDAAGNTNEHDHEYLWFSNIIARTMIANVFDFSAFDSNANHVVEAGELGILIYSNERDSSGSARWTTRVKAGSSTVAVDMRAAEASHLEGLNLIAHETSHILDTEDLYGQAGLSADLSLLAARSNGDPDFIYHMDPWHKMSLGWIEPRIRSLRSGGIETIRSVNALKTDQTVLFWDPDEGPNRYFLVEYRSRVNPPGASAQFDRDVAGTGIVIWSVELNSQKRPLERVDANSDKYRTVYALGAPGLSRGGNTVWTSDTMTPNLVWDDGTVLPDVFRIHSFHPGDDSITFECWREGETWVEFGYGGVELGTFTRPWNTLGEGLGAVPYGGTLTFKAGRSSATARISKRMKMQAYGGAVILGR